MNLLSHQQEAFQKLNKYKVGALFMEPGTGKTRTCIELVNSVPYIDYILYVAPLRTIKPGKGISSVIDEVNKWGGFNASVDYIGVESIGSSDRIYLEIRNKLSKCCKPFIIVDESLKIKNFDAKRTKRLLDLSSFSDYKLILNGTPVSRDLLDVWAQFEFLSPKILGMALAQFKDTFCCYTTIKKIMGGKRVFTKEFITGYENIDYLHNLIHYYIYECDLKLELEKQFFSFKYTIDDDSMEEYKFIKEKYLDDETLQWKNNNIFLEMTQKMQHSYCITEDKFRVVDELFKSVQQDKTIIFCKYVNSRIECEKRYPKAKVLSYQTAAYGLNLQDYCNTIYFDKVWDYALKTQSINRTHRTGQTTTCRYYDLTGNVGLETLIEKNLSKKVGMVDYFKNKSIEEIKKEL